MTKDIFGQTSQGLPIPAYHFGQTGPAALILGGAHGDEPEGIYASHGLLQSFLQNFPYRLRLTLVPILNMEGALLAQRTNANKIDLNRNLPAKSWTAEHKEARYNPGPAPGSEPENQALTKWIESKKPKIIISLHSWNPVINTNGDCSPEAEIIAKATGYKISDCIGYPTPGSLGDYCGRERGIPVITYEVERGSTVKETLALHVPAIKKALFASENR